MMAKRTDMVLSLQNVSRVYPRDISDTPSALLREMFLPRALLKHAGSDEFFALRDINLDLEKGQKLGVIGAHRSGKSTLAGIASGLLLPTAGRVSAHGSRLLISRPTAGFKPTLTVLENLVFRAALAGLCGQELNEIVDTTLLRCGVAYSEAKSPMGNLSPYIVKQLGMSLLLEMPAEILIIDELSGAGVGGARWETRGHLQNRIENSTALIISEDPVFLEEATEECLLLSGCGLSGPFKTSDAVAKYYSIVDGAGDEPSSYGCSRIDRPSLGDEGSESSTEFIDTENSISTTEKRNLKKEWEPIARIANIFVDDTPYSHSKISLIRKAGESLNLKIDLMFTKNTDSCGCTLALHPEFGNQMADTKVTWASINFQKGQICSLHLMILIPNVPHNSYGLSITPNENHDRIHLKNRLKVLKFGLYGHTEKDQKIVIDVKNSRVELLSI